MTYSHLVMTMWSVALLATLVGLVLVGRTLARAEAATARIRDVGDGLEPLVAATGALDAEVRAAARRRMVLHTRARAADPERG